jgi:hypothetical protein
MLCVRNRISDAIVTFFASFIKFAFTMLNVPLPHPTAEQPNSLIKLIFIKYALKIVQKKFKAKQRITKDIKFSSKLKENKYKRV